MLKSVNITFKLQIVLLYKLPVFEFDLQKVSSMPFSSSCCCPCHDEWKHDVVGPTHLRICTRKEAAILNFSSDDPKNETPKRKICIYCHSRLEVEVKCSKLEVSFRSVNLIITPKSVTFLRENGKCLQDMI